MLRLSGGQVESLFDLGLPVEVRELPADFAALDGLLADPARLSASSGRGTGPLVAMAARRSPIEAVRAADGHQAALGLGL